MNEGHYSSNTPTPISIQQQVVFQWTFSHSIHLPSLITMVPYYETSYESKETFDFLLYLNATTLVSHFTSINVTLHPLLHHDYCLDTTNLGSVGCG